MRALALIGAALVAALVVVVVVLAWIFRPRGGPLPPGAGPLPAGGPLARLVATPGLVVLRPQSSYSAPETQLGMSRLGASLAARGLALEVLDISREGGGSFPPHVSHKTGRDVDARYLADDAALIVAMLVARPRLVLTSRGRVNIYKRAGLPAVFWPGHVGHVHLRF